MNGVRGCVGERERKKVGFEIAIGMPLPLSLSLSLLLSLSLTISLAIFDVSVLFLWDAFVWVASSLVCTFYSAAMLLMLLS